MRKNCAQRSSREYDDGHTSFQKVITKELRPLVMTFFHCVLAIIIHSFLQSGCGSFLRNQPRRFYLLRRWGNQGRRGAPIGSGRVARLAPCDPARTSAPETPAAYAFAYCPRFARGLGVRNKRGAFAHDSRRRFRPAGAPTAAYCRVVVLPSQATYYGGFRVQNHNTAAAFGSHKPRWSTPILAYDTLWVPLLGLAAMVALGSHRPLTPYGESGIAYGFCSFVAFRVVVGKHISPTPLCCSVGSGVAAATSEATWGKVYLALPRAILL